MLKINDESIPSWFNFHRVRLPEAIDTICSICSRPMTFNTRTSWDFGTSQVFAAVCRCTACSEHVLFVGIKSSQANDDQIPKAIIFQYPVPNVRGLLSGFETIDSLPERSKNAYKSAVNIYNVSEWAASSNSTRRALEAITAAILPEDKRRGNLWSQIEQIPTELDLSKPITDLAHTIRTAGNIGSHFSEEGDPNEEVASLMLDLLDYLIEYLFILPEQILSLQEAIIRLDEESSD